MKSEQPEEGLLRAYHKNAEAIRALQAANAKIRKMLAPLGIVPDGEDQPQAGIVHQLRVIAPERTEESPQTIAPPAKMNIKPMVRKVLSEHFKSGATNGQIAEFFEKQWEYRVRTDTLSVQLSELKKAGEIYKKNQLWFFGKQEGPGE